MLVTNAPPDVLVPSSELALYATGMPFPGLLPLPARGLLPDRGGELLPCLTAARKLRCTLTCTVASAWGMADITLLAAAASGGLRGPASSGGLLGPALTGGLLGAALPEVLVDSSPELFAGALKGLLGGWPEDWSRLGDALESGDRLPGFLCELDSDMC